MRRILIILIISTLGLSCTTLKGPYSYGICVKQNSGTSLIVSNEVVGIEDTTIAFLSGQISDVRSKGPIECADVILKDTLTDNYSRTSTDSLGQFMIMVPARNFVLNVNYFGYSSIKTGLKLEPGERRHMKIELGLGDAFVTYEITSDKKLSKRQLRKRAEKLEKKQF